MEDVAPPQDPNPTMNAEYDSKPAGEVGSENGGAGDAAAASVADAAAAAISTTAAAAAASSTTSNEAGMMADSEMTNDEPGGLPSNGGGGNLYLRPIFMGNLSHNCVASDVETMFTNPAPMGNDGEVIKPLALDRVDMKRGYCFVFLKDPDTQAEKDRCEQYVADINGMNINQVSNALRAEFARGDGRVKKKEDERRKKILPNETLFVVNFHEETTKREDLQMLFEPYGELVRIDMKRNYAFVQFKTVEEAIRAKDATNGGKLDQSEITVEFVARRMGEGGGGERRAGGRRYEDDRRGGERGEYRGGRGGPPRGGDREYRPRGGGGGGGYRGDRYDESRDRGAGGGGAYRGGGADDRRGGGGGGGYRDDRRRRSRSRSRSPGYRRRSRSRSPMHDRDYRSSRDEYRPSSRGGRDSYEDRDRVERGYGRAEY